MVSRRKVLGGVSASIAGSAAGCLNPLSDLVGKNDVQAKGNNSDLPQGEEIQVRLPGEPKEIENGNLPIYKTQQVLGVNSRNFEAGKDENTIKKEIDTDESSSTIAFSPSHTGTGQATGFGSVTYQTAWTAPKTGDYQLRGTFSRSGYFRYDLPAKGNVMASFDVNSQLIELEGSQVIANRKFPQGLQSSTGISPNDLAELLIETGVTSLLNYYLGLSIIGRAVLSAIVSKLIDLDNPGTRGRKYDISHRVNTDFGEWLNIGGEFHVTKGTTLIFELSPMINWAYEISDTSLSPYFDGQFNLIEFRVKRLN